MSTLIRCYPGDRTLDLLLVVTVVVTLASGAAWFLARRVAGQVARRHRCLFSALFVCLTHPAVAWFCGALGLTLVSIPLLRGEERRVASGVTPVETESDWMLPRPSTDPPPAGPPLPATNITIDQSA